MSVVQATASEWQIIQAQAQALAQSDVVPNAYKRRPHNIVAAALAGRSFGWDVATSLRQFTVIEGTAAMRPEAQLGLVRAAGHSVKGETSAVEAVVTGTRADTGDSMTITFTMKDAERAGLAGKANWKNYPHSMLWWRAVGMLCRFHFSDVTLGVYSSAELDRSDDGELIEAEVVTEYAPVPLSEENLATFARACETEGLDPGTVLAEAFGEEQYGPLTDAHLPRMRDAFKRLVEAKAKPEGEAPAEPEGEADPAGAGEDDGSEAPISGTRGLPSTRAQIGKVKGEYARLGVEDRLLQLSYTSQILGKSLSTHNDLNRDEAHRLIEALVSFADAQDLSAKLGPQS